MSIKVGLVLFFLSAQCLALVPVEGLLMGEVNVEYQLDPLSYVFKKDNQTQELSETIKFKTYKAQIREGLDLELSCSNQAEPRYSTSWEEKQVKRGIAATLQYIGLDTSVKLIGTYSKKLLKEDEFKTLTENLMTSFCSKNLTVYSLRMLKGSLGHYYNNPVNEVIPDISNSPFAPPQFKASTGTKSSHLNELNLAIKNFKSFCSWGNDVSDYRLLAPYLKNKFIMAEVIRNLSQWNYVYDLKSNEIRKDYSGENVYVKCNDLICRKTSERGFLNMTPKMIGSISLASDFVSLYCHHFRFQDYKNDSIPQVKKWIKEAELEDPILETSFFFSALTKVPDPTLTVENYYDLQALAKTSFEERWNKWSTTVLSTFSTGLLFEESLKVKVHPRRETLALRTQGFGLDLSVTLGEMDRILNDTDKFKLSFNLQMTKNYMRFIRNRWHTLSDLVDTEGQKNFKNEIAKYIEIQISKKEKLFSQKMWNSDFSRLIAEELLAQSVIYKGPFFDSYKEEMLTIPVNFSYGVFALGYLRYRAEVSAGRLKLNL